MLAPSYDLLKMKTGNLVQPTHSYFTSITKLTGCLARLRQAILGVDLDQRSFWIDTHRHTQNTGSSRRRKKLQVVWDSG
jgi:hypothetical protein